MSEITGGQDWAWDEFGQAQLGNVSRTGRLVRMGRAAEKTPGGQLTKVFTTSADREAAYRFIESEHSSYEAVARAAHEATFRRATAAGLSFVYVPTDGTALSLPAAWDNSLYGPVARKKRPIRGRGVEALSAIAVSPAGTPLGPVGQVFWTRSEKRARNKRTRPLRDKETAHWLRVEEQVLAARYSTQSSVRPWFQLDRGGDFKEELRWAAMVDVDVTIRASHNRKVMTPTVSHLFEVVRQGEPLGSYELSVPEGPNRKGRKATMAIWARPVVFYLRDQWSKEDAPSEFYVVHAREVSPTPEGEKPIDWTLITNRKVETFEEAKAVVIGYSQRWKIEEVHKAWKAVCKVEDSELRVPQRLEIWATILFSVAIRIEHLKRLARETPLQEATAVLSTAEIHALQLRFHPDGLRQKQMPSIATCVLWIATLGGYTGKSSGGPPGTITLGRGLLILRTAVDFLEAASQVDPKT